MSAQTHFIFEAFQTAVSYVASRTSVTAIPLATSAPQDDQPVYPEVSRWLTNMPQIRTGCSPALFGRGTEKGKRICLVDGMLMDIEQLVHAPVGYLYS